jgi:hypothetical protein
MLVQHPDWCDETECAVQAGTGIGTHVSRKVWVKGRGHAATTLFLEESTDSSTGPRIVVCSSHGGREGAALSWPVDIVADVLAALDQVLAQLGPRPASTDLVKRALPPADAPPPLWQQVVREPWRYPPGEGEYAAAEYVEQGTDRQGPEGPAQVVIGVMRPGVEGAVPRWPHGPARTVHAALGELLDRLDTDGSG